MPKLILMFKGKILNAYPLTEGGSLTIGRHTDNDIVIENLAVSGHHARIDHRDGEITVTDLDSKNGTQRNGESISQCRLEDHDNITIGKHTLQADWTDTIAVERTPELTAELSGALNIARTMVLESPRTPKEAPEASPPPPKSPHPAEDRLAFLSGGEGEYTLSKKQVSIGKNTDADIVISGAWALLLGGPAAVITKQAGEYFLRYAGGLIRPKCNGASIKGTVKLNHDDVVDVGPVKLQIQLSERLAA
jgi:predicted component of type VI protein secretion system